MATERDLIAEQQAYYDAFIPANTSDLLINPDKAEIQRLVSVIRRLTAGKRVFDVCCGAGEWTDCYQDGAAELTLLDASPRRLQLCRERFGRAPKFTYIAADIFDWTPGGIYDTIVVTFWLSHVPQAFFARFMDTMRACLAPGGTVFLADHRSLGYRENQQDGPDPVVVRTVPGGGEYQVVKRLYEAPGLSAALAAAGWSADVASTPHFVYGTACPA